MKDLLGNEFYRSLVVPLPLKSLEKKLGKRRVIDQRVIKNLIDDYIKTSSEQYEALAGLMIELMNSEVSFQEPNRERIEEFQKKLEGLDRRFKCVDQFMEELSLNDRNLLIRDYVDETASSLRKHRNDISNIIKKKEEWNQNDVLFLSYYDRYTDFLDMIAFATTKDKTMSKFVKGMLYILAFLYQVVIYAYVKDELLTEVMLRRYSELALMTGNLSKRRSRLQKEIIFNLRNLPPPEKESMVLSTEN